MGTELVDLDLVDLAPQEGSLRVQMEIWDLRGAMQAFKAETESKFDLLRAVAVAARAATDDGNLVVCGLLDALYEGLSFSASSEVDLTVLPQG